MLPDGDRVLRPIPRGLLLTGLMLDWAGIVSEATVQTAAAARNVGVKEAQGDIVLFTDADCITCEEWISSMVKPFLSDLSIAGVGGTYETLNTESMTARFVGYDIAYRHSRLTKYVDHIGTYSAAFRKDALFDVGLFDESFGQADSEDNDISYRLSDRGYKLAFQPQGVVSHMHPSKAGRFLLRQFRRAYWRAALYAKHPRKMKAPDKYTTWQTQMQPFIWVIFALSALPLLFVNLTLVPLSFILTATTLVLLNGNFLVWLYSKEKSIRYQSMAEMAVGACSQRAVVAVGHLQNQLGRPSFQTADRF